MGASCFKGQSQRGGQQQSEGQPQRETHAVKRTPERSSSGACTPTASAIAGYPSTPTGVTPPQPGTFKYVKLDMGACRRFTLSELKQATDRFGEQNILSEGGRQALNVVYKGKLKLGAGGGLHFTNVAVKRFSKREWEDAKQFLGEVHRIAKVSHPNITTLFGYCSEEDDKLLVSEYMGNATLAHHLFHWEKQPMAWAVRLTIARQIASALDYLISEANMDQYHDLNPYRVLLDQEMQPRLSCFGLLKPSREGKWSSNLSAVPPELFLSGVMTRQSVVYMFGSLLMALFSGKSMRPMQFVEKVENKEDLTTLLDSHVASRPGVEQALELVPLIVECLRKEPSRRPSISKVAEFLRLLQDGPAQSPMGSADAGGSTTEGSTGTKTTPFLSGRTSVDSSAIEDLYGFRRAAEDEDMERLHALLCRDGLSPAGEPSFEIWNKGNENVLSSWRQGNAFFQEGQWQGAVDEYQKYVSSGAPPTPDLLLRRSFALMKIGQWSRAREDAVHAAKERAGWPEALCLEALALRHQGREEEAESIFSSVALQGVVR